MNKETQSIVIEARARIIWGESLTEIRQWLSAQGLSASAVETIISQCTHERAAEIRRIGWREVCLGGLLLLVCVGICAAMHITGIYFARIGILAVLIGLVGVWRITKGIDCILSGARARGSVTDM